MYSVRDGTGQDLETLKVPWSSGPGTKEVIKSRDLKMGKVPGKMPTLIYTALKVKGKCTPTQLQRCVALAVPPISLFHLCEALLAQKEQGALMSIENLKLMSPKKSLF